MPLSPARRHRPVPHLKLSIAEFCTLILFARPLTNAERQARHRAKLRSTSPLTLG